MSIGMVLLAGLLAAVAWLLGSTLAQRHGTARVREQAARRSRKYHAIEVRSHGTPCEIAQGVKGRRFLAAEAPPLPLPGCGGASCECYYQHHEDRRREDRRLHSINAAYRADERREERRNGVPGRRRSDALRHLALRQGA